MEALIASHEVEWFAAKLTFPCRALITLRRWEALRFATVFTYNIAPAEATFLAVTYRPHAILVEAHYLVALEAEEVV